MATAQLEIYNEALLLLGEDKLASLTENHERRRVLDRVWDARFETKCLQSGQWNFAKRTVQLDYSSTVTPSFGYSRAFEQPSDWVRTIAISADEFFSVPLTQYREENGFWYCDHDIIYVSYVSNDSLYGLDYSKWPETFTEFAFTRLAKKVCLRLTQDETRHKELMAEERKALTEAKSQDAMSDPTVFPPLGTWSSARLQGRYRTRDRTGGRLIG